jgi:hypothetical protein
MKKTICLLSAAFILAALAANADFDVNLWQYRQSILENGLSGFVLVDLDANVFDHANNSLSDLRIMDQAGTETPYTIIAEGDSASTIELPARIFDKSFVSGDRTVFTADMGAAGSFHNKITIHTNSENFRRMVTIEASNDLASWATLTVAGQIYDYTVRDIKPVKTQDTSVAYPESTARYLRVTVWDRGESPLNITGASVLREVRSYAKEAVFGDTFTVTQNAADRTTEITSDLGAKGIPTRRAVLGVLDANFNRSVTVLASNDDTNWQVLGYDYIYRINTDKFAGEKLGVSYPETQSRYVKFVISNGDDKVLGVQNLLVYGTMRKISFRYEQGLSYFLYFGNEDARRPIYDLDKLFPYLDTAIMSHASLGSLEKNPAFVASKTKLPLTERNKYFLPVLLGVIVAVMGFLIMRLFVKAKQS